MGEINKYSNMNKVEVTLETQKKEGRKHMMHPKFQTKKNKQKWMENRATT